VDQRTPLEVGITWYCRAEYDDLRGIMEDADKLHDTFDEWLTSAEAVERRVNKSGKHAIRVYLNRDDFIKWCDQHRRPRNAKSRSAHVVKP